MLALQRCSQLMRWHPTNACYCYVHHRSVPLALVTQSVYIDEHTQALMHAHTHTYVCTYIHVIIGTYAHANAHTDTVLFCLFTYKVFLPCIFAFQMFLLFTLHLCSSLRCIQKSCRWPSWPAICHAEAKGIFQDKETLYIHSGLKPLRYDPSVLLHCYMTSVHNLWTKHCQQVWNIILYLQTFWNVLWVQDTPGECVHGLDGNGWCMGFDVKCA